MDADFEGVTNPTVESVAESTLDNDTSDLSRATDQYETATDGSVVLVSAATVLGDYEIPQEMYIIMDHPEGVLEAQISGPNSTSCDAASALVHQRLVESQRPV